MSMPNATINDEVKQAVADAFERAIAAMRGSGAFSPRVKLLRVEQVEQATGIARSTIYKLVHDKQFPEPVKIGGGTFWRESSLIAFLDRQEGK